MRRRIGRWIGGLAALFAALFLMGPGTNAATGTLTPWPKPVFFNNAGDVCASCRVFTYASGTSTKITTWSNVGLTSANANPLTLDSSGRTSAFYLANGTSYKFVLCGAGSDDPCSSPIWTQDEVANVPLNEPNVDVVGIAGENLGSGEPAYLSDGSGGTTAGRWYKTNTANTYSSTNANVIGIPLDDASTSETETFRIAGRAGDAGLTPGAIYYLNGIGGWSTTAPANARPIFIAESATRYVLSHWQRGTESIPFVKTFTGGAPLFEASGQASNTARSSGRLAASTSLTNVGNVGTGEDTLHTFTIPAATLTNDGQQIRYTAWGTFAADADSKQVKCMYGATTIANGTASTFNGGSWRVVADIFRVGATTQRATAHYSHTVAAGTSLTQTTTTAPGETLSGTVVIRCTGESVDNNDIIQSGSSLEVIG